jgi:hypothetical protein
MPGQMFLDKANIASMKIVGKHRRRRGYKMGAPSDAQEADDEIFARKSIGPKTVTYTMALTSRQYRSHIDRNRGWPPRSQLGIVSAKGSTSINDFKDLIDDEN